MVMVVMMIMMPVLVLTMMSTLDDDVLRFLFASRVQYDMFAGPVICCARDRSQISEEMSWDGLSEA